MLSKTIDNNSALHRVLIVFVGAMFNLFSGAISHAQSAPGWSDLRALFDFRSPQSTATIFSAVD